MTKNGGYVATAPCGCMIGWRADLYSRGDIDQIVKWLTAGYTIRPLKLEEGLIGGLCEMHAVEEKP